MPPRSPKMKRRILGFQRRVWCPKCTPDSSSSRMPTSAIESLPCGVVVAAPGGVAGWAGPGACAGQGRLPRAPGGSPGSKRYENARPVYASSVSPLRFRGCGPALPSPTSGGPVRAFRSRGGQDGPPRSVLRRPLQRPREVGGEWRADVDDPTRDGVREGQASGVQELALEAEHPRAAVLRVARDGVADRLEVRADLVGAPRLEPYAEERERGQRPLRLEVGDRGAPVGRVGRDACAHAPVAPERRLDGAGTGARAPLDQREVLTGH